MIDNISDVSVTKRAAMPGRPPSSERVTASRYAARYMSFLSADDALVYATSQNSPSLLRIARRMYLTETLRHMAEVDAQLRLEPAVRDSVHEITSFTVLRRVVAEIDAAMARGHQLTLEQVIALDERVKSVMVQIRLLDRALGPTPPI